MASDLLTELQSDLKELETILNNVTRANVRSIIANEISTLKNKIDICETDIKRQAAKSLQSTPPSEQQSLVYTTKITTYGFDESSKFVKLYVTLKECEKLTSEQATCEFSDRSFKFVAHNHLGKNHQLQIVRLAENIVPEKSSCKVKSDSVVISLKKSKEGQTWGQLTDAGKKAKEAKDAKMDDKSGMDSSDPSGGIMNLMKKMYDDGDDDMKRMIKKTWYESQQKQAGGGAGGMPDMSSMPGMSGMPGMAGMPGM